MSEQEEKKVDEEQQITETSDPNKIQVDNLIMMTYDICYFLSNFQILLKGDLL